MAPSTTEIRPVLFISTIFYQSYTIHAAPLKNDPTLALFHRSCRITYCKCFWKYTNDRDVHIMGAWSLGLLLFIMQGPKICSINISI